ncbi:MAG: T9SS type A sorting domain-containing protein [Bacteroidota bacterium]
MKNKIHFTRSLAIAALAIFMLVPGFGWGQFYDGFTGTGNISGANGWVIHSGAGIIPINTGSLAYSGLFASTGNRVTIPGNNTAVSSDVNAALSIGVVPVAYFSALINVIDNTQIKTTSDYFMHFGATSGATVSIFGGRLGIKSVTGGFRLSIGNTSGGTGNPTYTDFAQDLVFGTTYLVVVKYDRSVSPNVAYLWVNPSSLGGTEPSGFVSNASGTSAFATFASICIRNSANTPKADIDEIRAGTTWADVTPSSVAGTPTKLSVTSVNGGSSPVSGVPISVVIQAQDGSNIPQPVTSDVNFSLTGAGIGGTVSGTMLNGQSSVTVTGVTMSEGYGLAITATQTSGTPTLTAGTSPSFYVTSATPSYRTKASGNWSTAGTWEIQISGNWHDAAEYPNATYKNATILSTHTIALTDNNGTFNNLTVDNGGKVWVGSTTTRFLYAYGNIICNGTIGDAGGTDGIGFDIEGTNCVISGAGLFKVSRLSKFTTTNAVTNLTFGMDASLMYSHATNSALYNFNPLTTTLNITLSTGKQLTVSNAKIDLTGCTLTMKSGASLLDNGTISGMNPTNVTVERYITGAPSAWHLLSSPVAEQAISPAFTVPTSTEYDFFTWYEQGDKWVNFKNTTILPTWNDANGSTNFVVGKGYLVQYLASNPTKIFTGALNTGTISFTMTTSGIGTHAKTNLAGNPYPSSIDWKSATGWDKSKLAVSGTSHNYYIWNDGVSQYGVYNDENSGDVGTNGVNRYIAPMQGFFVQTASAGDLSMTNAVRVHSSQAWLKSGGNEGFRLKVTAPENKGSDEILFELGHNSSLGGAAKWYSFVPTAPSLSTPKSGIEYSISFLETVTNETVIPVSFKAGIDGQYTINADLQQLPNAQVYLLDNKLVKTQNLSENPVYTFTASKNDDASRFVLHFGNVFGIYETANPQPVNVYSSNNTVYVAITKTGTVKGEVYVYNTLGQVLAHQNISGDLTKINLVASTGYYLVKVITAESTYTAKVFVKQQ